MHAERKEATDMGLSVSIFLLAVGAILTFAVNVTSEEIDLNAVGVILMVFGLVGLLASFILWNEWQPGRRRHYADREYREVDEPEVVARRQRTLYTDEPSVERRSSTTRRTFSG